MCSFLFFFFTFAFAIVIKLWDIFPNEIYFLISQERENYSLVKV